MGKKAYVECEHEYGENYYDCAVCHTNLTEVVKENLNELMLKTLKKEVGLLNFYCPGCKIKTGFQ